MNFQVRWLTKIRKRKDVTMRQSGKEFSKSDFQDSQALRVKPTWGMLWVTAMILTCYLGPDDINWLVVHKNLNSLIQQI